MHTNFTDVKTVRDSGLSLHFNLIGLGEHNIINDWRLSTVKSKEEGRVASRSSH
jgi:hypothetical protein